MKLPRYVVEAYDGEGRLVYRTPAYDDLQLLSIIIFFLRSKHRYNEIRVRRRPGTGR